MPDHRPTLRPNAAGRRLFAALTVAFSALLFCVVAVLDFMAQQSVARQQVLATASTLSEHAEAVFETAELTLDRIADREQGKTADQMRSAETHDFLVRLKARHPQFEAIFIIGADGGVLSSSRTFPLEAALSVTDRPYYQHERAGLRQLEVSAPVHPVLGGDLAFVISKGRFEGDRFVGLVGATVSPDYFHAVYRQSQDYPGHAVATLVRMDGRVLLRYPPDKAAADQLPPSSMVMQAVARHQAEGSFNGPSSIDGRRRLGMFHQLAALPIMVVYSIDQSVFLRAWSLHMVIAAAFTAALAALLLLSEQASSRKAEMRLQASRALAESAELQRRTELAMEKMQKMEALGRLTGGVAHDFNNLLTAIIGPMELLTKRINDPWQRRLLDTARQAAERGARLTSQMLAFARKRDTPAQLINPNHAIHGMGEMIARAMVPMVSITYDLDPEAAPVSADLIQLEMSVLNLCANARDAMPGGGRMTIRTELVSIPRDTPDLPAGRYVRLSVSDTGIGMDETTRARALEPFFTTKPLGQGTGLGLSTVYGLARAAGGSVTIDSRPGAGTTVSVLMPQRTGVAARPAPLLPPERMDASCRILLVDDDFEVRTATSAILQDFGHGVAECGSPQAALELLRGEAPFDLMLTDYAMPGMTGHELAQAARTLRPALPILFVTGYAEDGVLDDWERDHAAVLLKPFNSADLARALHATVQRGARMHVAAG